MSIYYVKQDNTIWTCGDTDCCGPIIEDVEESFVYCNCESIEVEMSEHLQKCWGGGPVLEWREATSLEMTAFADGRNYGFEDGYDSAVEFERRLRHLKDKKWATGSEQ